ncbi:MAG: hypothetical protein KF754_07140 [Planctomycetes bacterium]|nr:hypothetical protein [Planctomycetota bacterium]
MSWLPYLVLSVLCVAALCGGGMIALMGVDGPMLVGVGIGAGLGLGMMLLGWFTTLKSLRGGKPAALGHALGGFFLRLVVLTCGFFAVALTGAGNPAGFAIAFMLAVMAYLALQVVLAARTIQVPAVGAA